MDNQWDTFLLERVSNKYPSRLPKTGWYQIDKLSVHLVNDLIHSIDGGPAVIAAKYSSVIDLKIWYQHGLRHREDGPAYYSAKTWQYYIRGKHFNLDDWLVALDATDAEKVLLKMQWG